MNWHNSWGYYGTRGGYSAIDLDKRFLTEAEKEAQQKHFRRRKKPVELVNLTICPICHMQKSLNGSCSC